MPETTISIETRMTTLERQYRCRRWLRVLHALVTVVLFIYVTDLRIGLLRVGESVTTSHIALVDDAGIVRADLSALLGMTSIAIQDDIDRPRANVTRWADGAIGFSMHGANSSAAIMMEIDEHNVTAVRLRDPNGIIRLEAGLAQDGTPHLVFRSAEGQPIYTAP